MCPIDAPVPSPSHQFAASIGYEKIRIQLPRGEGTLRINFERDTLYLSSNGPNGDLDTEDFTFLSTMCEKLPESLKGNVKHLALCKRFFQEAIGHMVGDFAEDI
jgi:hypothetical protein